MAQQWTSQVPELHCFLPAWPHTFVHRPSFCLRAVSAYLYGSNTKESNGRDNPVFIQSRHMARIIGLTVIQFAWAFKLRTMHILQVIWAIGWSMILLSALVCCLGLPLGPSEC
jgi:uncharacterized membrane protein